MKIIVLLLLLTTLVSYGDSLVVNDKEYDCYGLIDSEIKDDNIKYSTKKMNIVWTVIFSETILVPIWLMGYRLKCPIGVKNEL